MFAPVLSAGERQKVGGGGEASVRSASHQLREAVNPRSHGDYRRLNDLCGVNVRRCVAHHVDGRMAAEALPGQSYPVAENLGSRFTGPSEGSKRKQRFESSLLQLQ